MQMRRLSSLMSRAALLFQPPGKQIGQVAYMFLRVSIAWLCPIAAGKRAEKATLAFSRLLFFQYSVGGIANDSS